MSLGKIIKNKRKSLHLTQGVLAKQSSISLGYLSEIENDRKTPSVETLQNIASALGCSTSFLLGEADDPMPQIQAAADGLKEKLADELDAQVEVMKGLLANPEKFAAAKLLNELEGDKLRKAFDFLSDQKQLADIQKMKGA